MPARETTVPRPTEPTPVARARPRTTTASARRPRLLGLLAGLTLAVAGLGACGGDGGSPDDASAGTSAPTTGDSTATTAADDAGPDVDVTPFVEVADAFAAATTAGDCPALMDTVSSGFVERIGGYDAAIADCEQGIGSGREMSLTDGNVVDASDATATVEFVFEAEDAEGPQLIQFVREDGEWKLDTFG